MLTFNRRTMLFGIAGVVGLAGAGSIAAVRVDWFVGHWLTALIRRHLPEARIAQAEIDAFITEISPTFTRRYRVIGVFRTLLPSRSIPVPSLETEARQIERTLLTKFLVGSNFFSIDPDREAVEYTGDAICANPFARFEFDGA
jgi:hypothetical protein